MVDTTAKLFWFRTKEWCANMADKLNDLVYTDDSKETVDVINVLLLGWILLGLIVYIIGNIIATQLRKRKGSFPLPTDDSLESTKKLPETPEKDNHVPLESEISFKSEQYPTLAEKSQTVHKPNIPICSGEDEEIVDWINNVFSWIYNQNVVSPLLDSLLSALNARARLASTEHGILLDFKGVATTPSVPSITNVYESSNTRGDVNVSCGIELENLVLDVVVTQFKEKDRVITPYTLTVQQLYGLLAIECIPEDSMFLIKFSEPPVTEIFVEASEDNNLSEVEQDSLKSLICEIATEACSSTIVNLKFSASSDCPKLMQTPVLDIGTLSSDDKDSEQLLVKIIKATNLGGKEGCLKPYCVVEMDDPPQKFETKAVEENHSPFWDDSFVFIVKDVSAELLFEIYDKEKPDKESFLGLGIVSVEELAKDPSQRQIIPLQSRPLEDDDITGSLTTEFLFLNKCTTPVTEPTHFGQSQDLSNGKTVETNSRVTSGGTVITTTTIKRTKEEALRNKEASPNLNNNSLPGSSDWQFLTTLHEVFEEKAQIMQKKLDLDKPTDFSSMNNNTNIDLSNNANSFNPDDSASHTLIDKNELESKTSEINSIVLNELCVESDPKTETQFPETPLHDNSNPSDDTHVEVNNTNGTNENTNVEPVSQMHVGMINESTEHSKVCLNSNGSVNTNSDLNSVNTTQTTEKMRNTVSSEGKIDGETDLTETALKELEKHDKTTPPSRSTLIIHSVQRVAKDKSGQWQEITEPETLSDNLEASPASHASKGSRTSYSESIPSSPSQDRSYDDRSRPKEKKSFIGNLRRKLSFRKTRSRSAEHRESSSNYSEESGRSASTEHVRRPSGPKPSPFKSRKFMGIKFLSVPGAGSERSSISEASGISSATNRTYINENSTLVVETNENGIIKRYLIPNSLMNRSKWKKRGIKLHIYNDHVFVAKHLSGSTKCQVCKKQLTRRPGKQGYECRGCNLQCHKSCHVKVGEFCSNSAINSMEVEYIHDPNTPTPKSS